MRAAGETLSPVAPVYSLLAAEPSSRGASAPPPPHWCGQSRRIGRRQKAQRTVVSARHQPRAAAGTEGRREASREASREPSLLEEPSLLLLLR